MSRRTPDSARLSHRFAYWTLTIFGWLSHTIQLRYASLAAVLTPTHRLVWAPPISLAATLGIDIYLSFPLGN